MLVPHNTSFKTRGQTKRLQKPVGSDSGFVYIMIMSSCVFRISMPMRAWQENPSAREESTDVSQPLVVEFSTASRTSLVKRPTWACWDWPLDSRTRPSSSRYKQHALLDSSRMFYTKRKRPKTLNILQILTGFKFLFKAMIRGFTAVL